MRTGVDPFDSDFKQEWIGLAYTQDLLYPIQFGSPARNSLGRIEYPYQFGSDPLNPMWTHGSGPELV